MTLTMRPQAEPIETYLIRYWKPGKYSLRTQYTVESTKGTEGVLTEAKAKVQDADTYSWCCDWLTQGGQTVKPEWIKSLQIPNPRT
jgi:hypothetical protein